MPRAFTDEEWAAVEDQVDRMKRILKTIQATAEKEGGVSLGTFMRFAADEYKKLMELLKVDEEDEDEDE